MTRIIAGSLPKAYLGHVTAKLIRLLALFALMLMPMGMGIAPAAAASSPTHATADMSSSGHCGDQTDKGAAKPVGTHCGGTCTALPLAASADPVLSVLTTSHQAPALMSALAGITTLPSTPPPRIA